MKKFTFLLVVIINFIMIPSLMVKAQITTSSMNGVVYGSKGETLPGATVVAIHQPTGSKFGTTTDANGNFRISNMNIGGPYNITVTFVGYGNFEKNDAYLSLGQTFKLNVNLKEQAVSIQGVEISAKKNDIFDGNRTGAETYVGSNEINTMPTITRDLQDFTKLTPQASLVGGGVSVAGVNNRYNSIFIDGAVNNDVFGLTSSGTNGGQTGIAPISIDAIEQFQIAVAPYDVKLGGFSGAGINAVTKSGTNEYHGSAYYYLRNENFAGKSPDTLRKKLDPFTAKTYGVTVGGPIIKNKLFFFFNVEQQRDETPNPYDFGSYTGNMKNKRDSLNMVISRLKEVYKYDPGTFENPVRETNSDKFLIRFDYNINKNHRLTLRHSYTKGVSIYPYDRSSTNQIVFYNNWVNFESITNSTSLELKSSFGNKYSNSFITGYTTVRDDRNQMGDRFPFIKITDGSGSIIFGSERYSSANQLNQDVFTITDNFEIYKGKHTITVGTHNEFYKMYNLYIRDNYGNYNYSSVLAFLQNNNATYSRSYSLVDDITGDGTAAAADFKAMQLGFYVQDEYDVNNKLKITGGIRLDIPMFNDNPIAINNFDSTITKITAAGYDLKGAQSGKMPKSQLMISPRVGFNYDVFGNNKTQLRGGIGIFTSRVPLVWPAGAYTNCGMIIGGISNQSAQLRPNWNDQYTAQDFNITIKKPSGELNLFSKDFKFPQVLRTSMAVDQKLPWWGLIATAELMYTKTLNNILYENVNIKPSVKKLTGTPDNRPIFQGGSSPNLIENTYTGIYLASNTNEGYSYNATIQIQKPNDKGFSGSIAYTLGHSKGLIDGTSSQNSSQWRYMPNVRGRNDLDLAFSNFDLGSRIVAYISYRKEYKKFFATSVSLYYNGQSGSRYSYVYEANASGYDISNQDRYNPQDLIYVPASASEINFRTYTANGHTYTAAEQWTQLEQFINNDDYLKNRKGQYAERNGARMPFEHTFDFKVMQDFFVFVKGKKNTIQLSFDIFNIGNLLNSDWGRKYYITNGYYPLIKFEGYKADGTTPEFTFRKTSNTDVKSVSDSGIGSSRWFAQFGVKYIF